MDNAGYQYIAVRSDGDAHMLANGTIQDGDRWSVQSVESAVA